MTIAVDLGCKATKQTNIVGNLMSWLNYINPLPATKKMHLKMSSAEVICCIQMLTSRTNFDIQTNSGDPDQMEQSYMGPYCLLQRRF